MTTARLLAIAAQKAREWTARRDALMCQMRDEGATLKEIAEVAKRTPPGVRRVLERAKETGRLER